ISDLQVNVPDAHVRMNRLGHLVVLPRKMDGRHGEIPLRTDIASQEQIRRKKLSVAASNG
ncbi:MAG: hypothetical protein ACJ8KC_11180, partial [Candidatus Udaeobacter sp.]